MWNLKKPNSEQQRLEGWWPEAGRGGGAEMLVSVHQLSIVSGIRAGVVMDVLVNFIVVISAKCIIITSPYCTPWMYSTFILNEMLFFSNQDTTFKKKSLAHCRWLHFYCHPTKVLPSKAPIALTWGGSAPLSLPWNEGDLDVPWNPPTLALPLTLNHDRLTSDWNGYPLYPTTVLQEDVNSHPASTFSEPKYSHDNTNAKCSKRWIRDPFPDEPHE